MHPDQIRERRIELFNKRLVSLMMKRSGSEEDVNDALALVRDPALPRIALELQPLEEGYAPGRWPSVSGLGIALEKYLSMLSEMDKVRFGQSSMDGLTVELHAAFANVVSTAEELARLGWSVNWQQNVQTILELTEFGLRDEELVHRFEEPRETVTLEEELGLLGTVTFFFQSKTADGKTSAFKPKALTADNRYRYGDTELHLSENVKDTPFGFRYGSGWLPGENGKSYQIVI